MRAEQVVGRAGNKQASARHNAEFVERHLIRPRVRLVVAGAFCGYDRLELDAGAGNGGRRKILGAICDDPQRDAVAMRRAALRGPPARASAPHSGPPAGPPGSATVRSPPPPPRRAVHTAGKHRSRRSALDKPPAICGRLPRCPQHCPTASTRTVATTRSQRDPRNG